ncbi:MAG: 23S rRNA (pseudouridine(1915)-N(3))-methyltransferase RlmH [Candidatus Eremiobacteraeota bacterium]|nr:23S rRNA (pseudouridine(1915)-N(3))-methyltransferase RlmH [Candidatus Eremiobacteraeota bacterium]
MAVGKIREPYVAEACADFRKRLLPYGKYEETEVRASDRGTPNEAMREEGERVLRLLRPGEPAWLLERTGTELSSVELSDRFRAMENSGQSRLTLIIAGTYGASPELQARAEFAWSLSKLTLLHEWARMLVLEQLYRAAKIARNEPYHH